MLMFCIFGLGQAWEGERTGGMGWVAAIRNLTCLHLSFPMYKTGSLMLNSKGWC